MTGIICTVIIVSFIGIYAGHFLFSTAERARNVPVFYSRISQSINGLKQEVRLLEVDVKSPKVQLKPVLAHDSVFGFESLSSMAGRNKAYAGVNGGFFYEYGQPSGMVVIDGEIITNSTGRFPVYLYDNGKASLEEISPRLWLTFDGKRVDVEDINILGNSKKTVLYTNAYGPDNRLKADNISVVIHNGVVTAVSRTSGKTGIPQPGMVLTFFEPAGINLKESNIQVGAKVQFYCDRSFSSGAQGYECGSWLIKDGQVVAGEWDEWVGTMSNQDPRTAIGIKKNGNVVLITIDGRQPGYSEGMTGRELGGYLLSLGVVDAAMLDGGASTAMIKEGRLVNRPSFRGEERILGGALLIQIK